MIKIDRNNIIHKLFKYIAIILLFISVLNDFDFNYLDMNYFSFNFIHILIFYCGLKKNINLGYGLIFLAGIINDTVINLPLGFSSLTYLLICVSAAYLRTITLRPSLLKDLIYFLVTILVVNSFSYILLTLIFSISLEYENLLINTFFTFLLYPLFTHLFNFYERIILRKSDV